MMTKGGHGLKSWKFRSSLKDFLWSSSLMSSTDYAMSKKFKPAFFALFTISSLIVLSYSLLNWSPLPIIGMTLVNLLNYLHDYKSASFILTPSKKNNNACILQSVSFLFSELIFSSDKFYWLSIFLISSWYFKSFFFIKSMIYLRHS